jgi:hypothetical protein
MQICIMLIDPLWSWSWSCCGSRPNRPKLNDSLPSTLAALRRQRAQQAMRALSTLFTLGLIILPLFYIKGYPFTLNDSFIPSLCILVGASNARSCFAGALASQVYLYYAIASWLFTVVSLCAGPVYFNVRVSSKVRTGLVALIN